LIHPAAGWVLLRDYLPWQQLQLQPSGQQGLPQPSGQQVAQQVDLTAFCCRGAWANAMEAKTRISERQAIVRFMDISLTLRVLFTHLAARLWLTS
jgi:hypothetical protein